MFRKAGIVASLAVLALAVVTTAASAAPKAGQCTVYLAGGTCASPAAGYWTNNDWKSTPSHAIRTANAAVALGRCSDFADYRLELRYVNTAGQVLYTVWGNRGQCSLAQGWTSGQYAKAQCRAKYMLSGPPAPRYGFCYTQW